MPPPDDRRTRYTRREADARLLLALDVSEDGIWDWNVATGECHMSDGWFHMLGHEPEPGPGHVDRWREYLHPEDVARVSTLLEQHYAGRSPRLDMECRFRHRNGSWVWIRTRGKVVERDSRGAPIRFIGRNVDITEWRLAEEERRRADTLFRTVISHAPFVLTVTDRDGVITHSEGGMLAAIGRTAGALVGRQMFELLGPLPARLTNGTMTTVAEIARRVLAGEIVESTTELASGVVHGNVSVPLRDASGNVTGIVGLSFDITERLRLSEQLRQAQKMEAVGQLAGGVAHDFNNLLTVFATNIELARDTLAAEHPARSELDEMEQATERARTLVSQLLTFSRKQSVAPGVQRIAEVVRSTERLLRRVIGEEITLRLEIADEGARALIDRGQLEQVILNLAVNARDAMLETPDRTGGLLRISVNSRELDEVSARAWAGASAGTWTVIEVSDTGPGMDATTLERACEPFFTTKPPGKGTGLGLATVYGIVNGAGGAMRISSTRDVGTIVSILLPTAGAEPMPSVSSARSSRADSGPVATILLVEDDPPVRTALRRMLERRGHTVIEASDGVEALAIWPSIESRVELLVSDIRMPRMGGLALVEELRRRRPGLPVLFVSGYSDEEIPVDDPAMVLVAKPFTTDTLIGALTPLLARRFATPADPSEQRWILDADDRIREVGGAFEAFAAENHAPGLAQRVIGQPIYQFIADDATRHVYRQLFADLRERGTSSRLQIRCDSPDVEREVELVIRPLSDGYLEVRSRILRATQRADVALLDVTEARTADRVCVCGWCKRIEHATRWLELTDAAIQVPRLSTRPLPALTHGMCPACEAVLRMEIEPAAPG